MLLKIASRAREVGSRELLDGFFATVGCRLEPAGRASRFPVVMDRLHDGRLSADAAPAALSELAEIESGLRALPAAKILWHQSIQTQAASAYDFFVSPDGQPLLAHLRAAVEECRQTGKPLDVIASDGGRRESWLALAMFLLGGAWSVAGYVLFPNWVLVSAVVPHDTGGIPIWTIGFLFMAMGFTYAIGIAIPGLRFWFARRQWALATVAIVGVLAWVFLFARP